MQYTNVSSPTDPNGGYTLNGIGWDVDDDGDIALIDTGKGNQVYESEDGFLNIRAATSPDRAVPRIMTMTTGRRATRMTCGAPDGILRIGRIGLRTMLKTNSAIQVGAFLAVCLKRQLGRLELCQRHDVIRLEIVCCSAAAYSCGCKDSVCKRRLAL